MALLRNHMYYSILPKVYFPRIFSIRMVHDLEIIKTKLLLSKSCSTFGAQNYTHNLTEDVWPN